MGLLTLLVIGIIILAIIGLGWQNFFSGVAKGVHTVGDIPIVKNAANEAKEYLVNATSDAAEEAMNGTYYR